MRQHVKIMAVEVTLALATMYSQSPVVLAAAPCLARPLITAAQCDTPPTIDGQLGDPAWTKAGGARFAARAGDLENRFYVCWDGDTLYVAVQCQEPHPSTMNASAESVEVFLAPDDRALDKVEPNSSGYYYRFAVTAENVRTAEHGEVYSNRRDYEPWRGKWQSAVHLGPDHWQMEMAIRLADFGREPALGELWGLTFTRHRSNENTSYPSIYWSSPLVGQPDLGNGGLHAVYFPHLLGLLRFAANGTVAEDGVGDLFPGLKQAKLTAHDLGDSEVVVRAGTRYYNGEATRALGNTSQAVKVRTRQELAAGSPESIQWAQLASDEVVSVEVIERATNDVIYASGQRYQRPIVRDRIWEEIGYSQQADTSRRELEAAATGIEQSDGLYHERLATWEAARDETRSALVATRHEQLLRNGPQENGRAAYGISIASSMTNIRPKAMTLGRLDHASKISLHSARNEMESSQVIVYSPHKDLRDVKLTASNLRGQSGAIIASEAIWVAPMGFVNTEQPSQYEVSYVGWWSDPILTNVDTFDVARNDLQPVWYSLRVPEGTKPGIYQGTLTISPANSVPAVIPVELEVWNFTLPRQPSLKTAVNVGVVSAYKHEKPSPERLAALHDAFDRYLMDHRCNPDSIYRRRPPDEKTLARWAEIGVTSFNIVDIRHSELDPGHNPYKFERDEIRRMIADTLTLAEKYGIADRAYVYLPDEAGSSEFPAIEELAAWLKQEFPDLRLGTTEKLRGPLSDEAAENLPFGAKSGRKSVDWICATTPNFNSLVWVDHVHNAGREAWWYTASGPYKPYADLNIEDPVIDKRLLLGFMSYAYRTDGFLYWSMLNDKGEGNEKLTGGPYTDWNPETWPGHNGAAQLFYPGQNGPITSIRMENWLDGMEDYEYCVIAEQRIQQLRDGRHHAEAKKLEAALEPYGIPGNEVVKSLTDYTLDPKVVETARRKIALAILEAQP